MVVLHICVELCFRKLGSIQICYKKKHSVLQANDKSTPAPAALKPGPLTSPQPPEASKAVPSRPQPGLAETPQQAPAEKLQPKAVRTSSPKGSRKSPQKGPAQKQQPEASSPKQCQAVLASSPKGTAETPQQGPAKPQQPEAVRTSSPNANEGQVDVAALLGKIQQLQNQVATLQSGGKTPDSNVVTPPHRLLRKTPSPASGSLARTDTSRSGLGSTTEREESEEEEEAEEKGEGKVMVVSPDGTVATRLKSKIRFSICVT